MHLCVVSDISMILWITNVKLSLAGLPSSFTSVESFAHFCFIYIDYAAWTRGRVVSVHELLLPSCYCRGPFIYHSSYCFGIFCINAVLISTMVFLWPWTVVVSNRQVEQLSTKEARRVREQKCVICELFYLRYDVLEF